MTPAEASAAPLRRWILPVAGAAAALAAGLALRDARLLEAWLLAFVTLSGLAVGSLGLLMIAHLLGDEWLDPIRPEFEAAALTTPLLALLALPLATGLDLLYPWTREAAVAELPPMRAKLLVPQLFLLRGALYLGAWTGLALWMTRTGRHGMASAIGLAILAATVSLAGLDWVSSREPQWWSNLFGFGFSVSQMLAALAAVLLVTLVRPGHPEPPLLRSLERALLTLALLTLWIWFVQFLIIWLANLPGEVTWYLARRDGWGWLMVGIVLPALIVAIVLLIPPGAEERIMIAASALLLVHHAGHMLWLIRPASPGAGVQIVDGVVGAGLGALWFVWFRAALRGRERDLAKQAESGSPIGQPSSSART
jgi:hypothetical protein